MIDFLPCKVTHRKIPKESQALPNLQSPGEALIIMPGHRMLCQLLPLHWDHHPTTSGPKEVTRYSATYNFYWNVYIIINCLFPETILYGWIVSICFEGDGGRNAESTAEPGHCEPHLSSIRHELEQRRLSCVPAFICQRNRSARSHLCRPLSNHPTQHL